MWRRAAIWGVMWAAGLAAAGVVLLLCGAGRTEALFVPGGAPVAVEAAAAEGVRSDANGQMSHPRDQGSVTGAWTSTTPVSTVISSNEYQVWAITRYGVTITFYANSVPLDASLVPGSKEDVTPLNVTAVFTFTPLEDVSVGLGVAPSHVFELEGRYSWGGVVSMNNVDLALQYRQEDLGEIIESSLHFYHYDPFARTWSRVQPGSLDVRSNVIACTTDDTGVFAVAGTRFQVYLPLALGD